MFSYAFATEIANDIVDKLKANCERIQIVGSLRRGKSSVNDIDIIATPRSMETTDDTLFGERVKENLLDLKLSELCLDAYLILEANGNKIKRFFRPVHHITVPIDLYIADEITWWTLLLIRTGSREHNIKLATRAIDLHMHLKSDGSGLLSPDGTLLRINSEEEIFKHLHLTYKPPAERY
jgi:DNA polymerase/3'-5' exonuclease PolX